MNSYKIEKIKTLKELYSSYEVYKFIYPEMTQDEFEANVKWMFQNGIHFICVKQNKKIIASCCYWEGIRLHSGKFLQIDSLIVHPKKQKSGIGKQIIKYLEDLAEKQGAKYYVLDVYTENHPAIKLYAKDDFKLRGYHIMKAL